MAINLLHPESLDCSQLTKLLQERGVTSITEGSDKFTLVELFYTHVLPLPQRKHRQNRSGKLLRQSQINLDRGKRRVHFNEKRKVRQIPCGEKEEPTKKFTKGLVNNPVVNTSSHTSPISNTGTATTIDFERKRIKLSSSSPKCNPTIKQPAHDTDSSSEPPNKKPRTKITWP